MTNNNNLKFIDGCMDGWDCPDADLCNEHRPECCPLMTDQFELDPGEEVDTIMNDA